MSMSTHVVGFRPPDDTWRKHKAVWDACVKAGVHVPKETNEFFGYDKPDDAGVTVELEKHECCAEFSEFGRNGIEIDLSNLPKQVTKIRFYNSW